MVNGIKKSTTRLAHAQNSTKGDAWRKRSECIVLAFLEISFISLISGIGNVLELKWDILLAKNFGRFQFWTKKCLKIKPSEIFSEWNLKRSKILRYSKIRLVKGRLSLRNLNQKSCCRLLSLIWATKLLYGANSRWDTAQNIYLFDRICYFLVVISVEPYGSRKTSF